MRFRKAAPDDLTAVVSFYGDVSDAMIGTAFDCQWRRDKHPTEAQIADAIAAQTLTIVDDGGAIAAAVIVNHDYDVSTDPEMPWSVDCAQDEAVIIHVLAVSPAYRGGGVARELLSHVLDEARATGMRSVRLGAALSNTPAVRLYERSGFQRVIVAEKMFGDVKVDAVVFELPLQTDRARTPSRNHRDTACFVTAKSTTRCIS